MYEVEIERAAEAVAAADALLIGAGAGMSVDAGIPAYRLNPPSRPATLLAALSPVLFKSSPELAWGRTGRQLVLFRETRPHRGYEILEQWSRAAAAGSFVITSNVDGMFLAAGFAADRVLEGHGSAHFMQCTTPCTSRVWSAADYAPRFEADSEYVADAPRCPDCGAAARPNIFMFGDSGFNPHRAEVQSRSLDAWLASARGRRFAVIECGAGTAVPTIRRKCEAYARELGAPLVRINLAECHAGDTTIALPLAAEDALGRMAAARGALA
jgi:NAD-dependent SIR2 family protein deacetylase